MTAAILGLSAVSPGNAETARHCDRTCMTALVDQYLAALVKPGGAVTRQGRAVYREHRDHPRGRRSVGRRVGSSHDFQDLCHRSRHRAGEIFKIRGGKIHEIEAMGTSLPYGTLSGWE
jgi:hypothetical protein